MYWYRCPHCDRQGFVRAETVIRGGSETLELYNGHRHHTWKPHDETPSEHATSPRSAE